MPIYDYACSACGHRFEAIHGVHDAGPATCPTCGSGPVKKAFAAPAVLFKGSGWAKVDRRSTSSVSKARTDDAPAATSSTGDASATGGSTPAASGADSSSAASTSTD